ncbi:hypothetical protein KY290_036186 [Solanum tuberosum]|uniref:Uncharacterized protein n=1 Tax=Solanum tuberosum TaxID=4113 RepID=A0ABQ7TSF7_SOLTU|nr:hypothetical protein KY285_037593 [Solanum tuberosum]KAH0737481.1 hypothetical protein KY290_036186 [Solanum tuberosum]
MALLIQRAVFIERSGTSPSLASPRSIGYLFLPTTLRTTVPSNFQTSFAFKSAYETQNSKEDHVSDKLHEQYHTVDSCEFTNRGITGIKTVDDIITPRNGRSKSTTALVQKPSVVTKDTVFVEMSYTTVSPNLHDPNASVHDEECSAFVVTTASDTSIYRNANLQPEVTIKVLNESSHNIKFGEIRSIASQVSLLITFEAPEVIRPNEHLERDVSTRYVNVNSLANGSPIWKTDLESFKDLYLADLFMEHVGNEDPFLNILISLMHSVKILPNTENGKSTWEFNGQHIMSQFLLVPTVNLFIVTIPMIAVDLCVWDPGIGFDFTVLTSYTVYNVKELLLLGCTDRLFLIVHSNSMNRVWDPGQ